jgi:hypothetical protein
MGPGVARQCSRNRRLALWIVWISHLAAEAEQVERTRGKTWSRPDPRFLCPSGIQMGIRATSLETLEVEKRVDVAYEVGRYALLIQARRQRIDHRGRQ